MCTQKMIFMYGMVILIDIEFFLHAIHSFSSNCVRLSHTVSRKVCVEEKITLPYTMVEAIRTFSLEKNINYPDTAVWASTTS